MKTCTHIYVNGITDIERVPDPADNGSGQRHENAQKSVLLIILIWRKNGLQKIW